MKQPSVLFFRLLNIPALSIVCLLALPQTVMAKGPGEWHGNSKAKSHNSERNNHDDHDRRIYSSRPRSSFTLTLGTGYAGRGYYYGPSNSPYYYERSDVRYYATREAAPREYYSHSSNQGSTGASVQRELARRGYYHGYVDGAIGPQSQRAIVRYQQDRGLRPTGTINSSLLRSLGLY
ncbi:MAG: peptidoglycan-binding domain-containing protein [Luteolibacter sp.]